MPRLIRYLVSATFLALVAVPGHTAETAKPVTVIAAFNLTGPDAVLDKPSYQGAELAADRINAGGGVLGRPIRLVAVDTASDTGATAKTVEAALESNPDAVAGLGFSYSTFAQEAGRVFQERGLPFITSGATAPDLPETVGDDMFLAAYGDDVQARAMAQYARDRLGLRRIALWIDESRVYTKTVGHYFGTYFAGAGGSVDRHGYAAGETDFSALIAAFEAADPRPEAIYAASTPGSSVTLIEQVRAAGIDVPLMSGDGWDDRDIVDLSKRLEIGGLYFTTHLFLGVETPAMRYFVKAYQEKYGLPPANAFAPLGYDTVDLLADAIRRAGATDPASIGKALAGTRDFDGIVGPIGYRSGRHVPDKPVAIIAIDEGTEKPVWTWTPKPQK